MMYLLDTNVVSELRKIQSGKANNNVATWANTVDASTLFLSVITIMELELGVLSMERKDPSQAMLLRTWLEQQVLPEFSARILFIDAAVALRSAKLHVPNRWCSERDALIATTALVHSMTVVTRNVSDFKPTGVNILNPWEFGLSS